MHLLVSFFVRTLTLLPIVLCCILLYLIITSNSNTKIEEVIHLISLGIVRLLLMQVLTWDFIWKFDLSSFHRPNKPFTQASPQIYCHRSGCPRWNEDVIYIYYSTPFLSFYRSM